MAVTGDFRDLQQLIGQLVDFSTGKILKEVSDNLAEEAIDLIKQGFDQERDPYGNPWAPLKHRAGHILEDTARLRNSFTRGTSSASGFSVGTNVTYAKFHQEGAQYKPRTQTLAFAKKGGFQSRAASSRQKNGAVRIAIAQRGSHELVARPMVPTGELPESWQDAFVATANEVIEGYLKP